MSFSNASNFIINGPSTFVDDSLRNGREALQLLSQHVAQGATHDSYAQDDAPRCHPKTRIQLLSDVNEWMLEPNKETGILYLHGPAGAGKSCIARSACERAPAGFLLASFFFWRGSEYRNNTMRLITTVAYQFAKLNSELAEHILTAIQQDPRIIYDSPVDLQFQKLILEPCHRVVERSGGPLNGVIIIDGLDECLDKDVQISVLNLLTSMVNQEKFPLGFFITSRPELHLKEVWDTADIASVTQFISLSNIRNTSKDIRTVLQSGFLRILNDGRFRVALQSVPRPWPKRRYIKKLVKRSSGQFIYAATVLKFISNRSRNPATQLKIVLALPACDSDPSPLAELDILYRGILSRADDPDRTIEVLSYLLTIMHLGKENIIGEHDISRPFVKAINAHTDRQLLIVELLTSLPRGEAFLALNDLHSLIDLRGGISFYHKSFRDFLLTFGRSKEFYVNIQATHAKIVQSCLKILCLPKYNTPEQHVGWLYSFFVWPFHIRASRGTEEFHNFEHPVQRIRGTQLHISWAHLEAAFKILGLVEEKHLLIEVAKVLTGFRRLSASVFFCIRLLWGRSEFSRFKESMICSPLMVAHLKSYQMDVLTVKRSLAIHVIIPLSRIFDSELYSTGIIHELTSLPEIQQDMLDLGMFDINSLYPVNLLDFLSNYQSSGIFSCTPEDFAEAYSDIISVTTPVSSERQEDMYSNLLETWTYSLEYIKPAATSSFLTALNSAARDAHGQLGLNRSLTHKAEVFLFKWLENLPTPPQYIVDAWRKAFDKARRATLEHRDGYGRYYCS